MKGHNQGTADNNTMSIQILMESQTNGFHIYNRWEKKEDMVTHIVKHRKLVNCQYQHMHNFNVID